MNFIKSLFKPQNPYAIIFQALAEYDGDKKALLETLLKSHFPDCHIHKNPKGKVKT